LVTQYKREIVSASIGHPTSPSQISAIPVTPQPPEPGSRAAGSSPRRTGRDVARIQHTVRYAELSPDRFRDFWRD